MKVTVHFFQLNSDFSPEHAEAHHNGEESENNLKHDWEDEFEVSKDLVNVEIERKGVYTLQGFLADDTPFSEDIPNMFLITMTLKDGQKGYMGISESMLLDFKESGTKDHPVYKIYVKDYEPCWNEIPGVFVASNEFPKNLKLHDID